MRVDFPQLRRCEGFTLIELMVVLVLMALLSGLIITSAATALRRKGLEAEGERLEEVLRFARFYALSRNKSTQVNFDTGQGLCWVATLSTEMPWLEEREATDPPILRSLRLDDKHRMEVRLQEREQTGNQDDTRPLIFRGDGQCSDARIMLVDRNHREYVIEVTGATGDVRRRSNAT